MVFSSDSFPCLSTAVTVAYMNVRTGNIGLFTAVATKNLCGYSRADKNIAFPEFHYPSAV